MARLDEMATSKDGDLISTESVSKEAQLSGSRATLSAERAERMRHASFTRKSCPKGDKYTGRFRRNLMLHGTFTGRYDPG